MVSFLLKKLFEFYPQARGEALEVTWTPAEHLDAFGNPWMTVNRVYIPRQVKVYAPSATTFSTGSCSGSSNAV